jgi:hypothetical protein
MKPKSGLETDLLSWLESNSVDHIADYVARGRRYSGLQGDELLKRWKDTLRLMATDPVQPEHQALYSDLGDEITLRGMKQPYDEVKEIFEVYMRGMTAAMEKAAEDPVEAARINDDILTDVEKFRKRREQPQ